MSFLGIRQKKKHATLKGSSIPAVVENGMTRRISTIVGSKTDSIPFSSLWTSRTVQGELEDAFSAVLFNWPVFTPARFNHLYSLSSAVYNKRLYQQASDDDEGTQDKSPATGNYRMDLTHVDPDEYGRCPVVVQLGDCSLAFDENGWRAQNGAIGEQKKKDSSVELKKANKKLEGENALLRYKVEVLLDMLATSRSDFRALEDEFDDVVAEGNQN